MKRQHSFNHLLVLCIIVLSNMATVNSTFAHATHTHADRIRLSYLSSFHSSGDKENSTEILAYDSKQQLIFVCNSAEKRVDAISLSELENPLLSFSIDLKNYGYPNSVALNNEVLAIAIENDNPQINGSVLLFNTKGEFLNQLDVGAMPDMVTFSPNGKHILVANEGEPNDAFTVDPEGSVSIIDINKKILNLTQKDVRHVDFRAFNKNNISASVRIHPASNSVAQDLEPEHISVTEDSQTAWVSLQENNALAKIDIKSGRVEQIYGLGSISHNSIENAIDASDKDGGINLKPWPVEGLFQPDTIATYEVKGQTFIVTANEGDTRDYDEFKDNKRVGDLNLDLNYFDGLNSPQKLGRLKVSTLEADSNNDGLANRLVSFGTRSFSIWDSNGQRVFDSGSDFARITARDYPKLFNANDQRSDNKGSEPEALTIGKVENSTYAFIGLERTGGIMVYNINNPNKATFVDYINNISPSLAHDDPKSGDRAPESIVFVSDKESPNGKAFIVTANEMSGTVSVYQIRTL